MRSSVGWVCACHGVDTNSICFKLLYGVQVKMTDPVVAADGHTYERAAIAAWLQRHNTSPVTKQLLPHTRIFSNQAAKAAMANQHAL